jgi:drug/metabolite transporter (DMT)-like permease
LVLLAAIWGASFLFTRIVAPVLGPLITADSRMLVAGAALALWFRLTGFDPQWRRWWPHYAGAGMINTGIPFTLWAFAALYLTTGELAVLNATSPMWGAVMSAAFLGERLTPGRIAGLALGIAGVAFIAAPSIQAASWMAWSAGLAAAACYGFIGVYLRRWAPGAPARGLAVGTQLGAGLAVLPLAALFPPAAPVSTLVIASVLALGLVCGAVAYVLYFRLIADLGATGALTVTYLIPLFAMLWGALFLAEPVTLPMAGGAALVIAGTILVLRN